MKALLTAFVISFFLSFGAQAEQPVSQALQFGGWSYHYLNDSFEDEDGDKVEYNQSHQLLGWRWQYEKTWTEAGTFVNSYHKRSFYVAKGFNIHRHQYYHTGLIVGLVSGYHNTEAKSVVYMGLSGGVNITKHAGIDAMLGWGQANVTLRMNF